MASPPARKLVPNRTAIRMAIGKVSAAKGKTAHNVSSNPIPETNDTSCFLIYLV